VRSAAAQRALRLRVLRSLPRMRRASSCEEAKISCARSSASRSVSEAARNRRRNGVVLRRGAERGERVRARDARRALAVRAAPSDGRCRARRGRGCACAISIALVVGRGPDRSPGSVSPSVVAQGLAYGASLPVIPVSDLAMLAQGAAGPKRLRAVRCVSRRAHG
jgi:hypothetical protein